MAKNVDERYTCTVNGDFEEKMDQLHLGKVIMKSLRKYSHKINQIDVATGQSETCESVLKRSIILAVWMKSVGIEIGDVIMLSAANHLDVTIVVVAAFFIGAIILSADINLNNEDLRMVMELGEPKMIFCDDDVLVNLEKNRKDFNFSRRTVTFGTNNMESWESFCNILNNYSHNDVEAFTPTDFDPDLTACFIYCTSGSTGTPKGVVVTHKSYLACAHDLWYPIKGTLENEIFMTASPLHWITSSLILLTSLVHGTTRIISSLPFTADIAHKILKIYKPTLTLLGPSALISMLEYENSNDADWLSLRYIHVGGSVLSMDLAKAVQEKIVNGKIVVCYGMTEVAGVVASNVLECPPKDVALGFIRPILKAKVIDSQGNELGPGERGELLLKGDVVFKEYYKNEKATKEAFMSDGWFKTGDIVYYDDRNTFFYVDRLKLMMKYKNHQISPIELENVISKHTSVAMVAVDKLYIPPDELPIAFVVKKQNENVCEQDIKDLVSEKLASYKQLHGGVIFLESMPFLANGKIDRQSIRKRTKEINISISSTS